MYFYLHLFLDLFSRQIVGWQVYDCESTALASELLQHQALCDNCLTSTGCALRAGDESAGSCFHRASS
jgi:hypothetical protein